MPRAPARGRGPVGTDPNTHSPGRKSLLTVSGADHSLGGIQPADASTISTVRTATSTRRPARLAAYASRIRMDTSALVIRLLDVIEFDIAAETRQGVAEGNKLFGAAILRKSDLSVVVADTNKETENPLWHGEIHVIKRFYELPADERPMTKDCLFLATHEPCSLCLSGITWSGFDNFYFLFGYEDTRDSFGIPHDIAILREVFAVPDPGAASVPPDRPLYNRVNPFWHSHDIKEMIASLDEGDREALAARLEDISDFYSDVSMLYQQAKGSKGIPLA